MLPYAQRVYACFTGPLACICEWKHVCCLMHFYVKVYGLFVCYFEISQKTVVSTIKTACKHVCSSSFFLRLLWKLQHGVMVVTLKRLLHFRQKLRYSELLFFDCHTFIWTFFHVVHLSYQCVFLNFCNKLFQFWLRLLGMKQQLLWRHCNIRRMKLDRFETGPREWYWLRKRWFWIFPHLSMFFFICFYLVFSTCFCHSYMICSYRFRKKLF